MNRVRKTFLAALAFASVSYGQPGSGPISGGGGVGGGIGGSTGSTDNAPLCADGTGGNTAQACGHLLAPDGSESAPAYSFASDPDTGFYLSDPGTLTPTVGGAAAGAWTASGFIGFTDIGAYGSTRIGLAGGLTFSSANNPFNDKAAAFKLSAAGIIAVTDGASGGGALHLTPLDSPPRTCDATAEGDLYSDTSHALCWCDGSSWQKLSGAGTCA